MALVLLSVMGEPFAVSASFAQAMKLSLGVVSDAVGIPSGTVRFSVFEVAAAAVDGAAIPGGFSWEEACAGGCAGTLPGAGEEVPGGA